MPSIDPKTTVRSFVGLWDNPADLRNKWWGDTTRLRSGLSLTHSRKLRILTWSFLLAITMIGATFKQSITSKHNCTTPNWYMIVTLDLNANFMQRKWHVCDVGKCTNAYVPLADTDLPSFESILY